MEVVVGVVVGEMCIFLALLCCVFKAQDPNASPAPEEASNLHEIIAMRFWNSSILPCKSLNRNLLCGFPIKDAP